MSERNKKRKNKKKKKSILEKEILSFMRKSMEAALDLALDDIFGKWK